MGRSLPAYAPLRDPHFFSCRPGVNFGPWLVGDQCTHAFPANDEGLQEHDEEAINFEKNRQRADNGEGESPGGVFSS